MHLEWRGSHVADRFVQERISRLINQARKHGHPACQNQPQEESGYGPHPTADLPALFPA